VLVMAQANGQRALEAYRIVPSDDRRVLEAELSLSGLDGQCYHREQMHEKGGPAFLPMYAPALLQYNGGDLAGALQVLAEILRQARVLWPLDADAADDTVLVMLDALKESTPQELRNLEPGDVWVLQRLGPKAAQVRKVRMFQGGEGDHIEWSAMRPLSFAKRDSLSFVIRLRASAARLRTAVVRRMTSRSADSLGQPLISSALSTSELGAASPQTLGSPVAEHAATAPALLSGDGFLRQEDLASTDVEAPLLGTVRFAPPPRDAG